MNRSLTLLFAVAAGAAVGNMYYAQPLLDLIGSDLGAGHERTGLLITATQIGYAVGVLLIVPLGDIADRRRLIPLTMLLAAAALAGAAAAPSIGWLAAALAAVGLTTVAGQLLTPLAGDLADDAHRGRTIGIVVSGLLTGILLARTLGGLLAAVAGWRWVFVAAAALTALIAIRLRRAIPRLPDPPPMPYARLLASVAGLALRHRTVRVTMLLGALAFATFTLFWTSLTFLLSDPPYRYPTSVIGLFGVAGLLGSLAAQGAGRLHDRGWSRAATGSAWAVLAAAWLVAWLGGHVIALVVAAIVLLDIAVQGQHILNQSRLFALPGVTRSRVNTAYVTANFTGGAAGSAVAAVLWPAGGWPAVCAAGLLLSVAGALTWLLHRRGALSPPPAAET